MTERGTFKRSVRREARAAGERYTEALARLSDDPMARMRAMGEGAMRGKNDLTGHLESVYGIQISGLEQLSPHGSSVFRVDRSDGAMWVARVFGPIRPIEDVEADEAILKFLEQHQFPAERCAHPDPVSTYAGLTVLVTEFVPGEAGSSISVALERELGDLLGRLHALPHAGASTSRDGGSFSHDPLHAGRPADDLTAALGYLASVEPKVPADQRAPIEALRALIATVDDAEGLPEALTHGDLVDRNVILTPGGQRVGVDWRSAGIGPRLPSLAFLLEGAGSVPLAGPALVEAIAEAYTAHVQVQTDELERLPAAMRRWPVYLACWRYMSLVNAGEVPSGNERWWPNTDRIDRVASQAVAALQAAGRR